MVERRETLMHPTLIAMVAAEREVATVRGLEQRRLTADARVSTPGDTRRFLRRFRGTRPTGALAGVTAAVAQLVSRRPVTQRGATAAPDVCCA
jgi:hypothetical protein